MGISYEDWTDRIANRSDLTGRLTHLTKPNGLNFTGMTFEEINLKAVDNLIKILTEKRIYGSTTQTKYVIGEKKAVCFQDAPIYALIQNIEYERKRRLKNPNEKLRYCGVGISFIKPVVYASYGGRPVLYEKSQIAKKFLKRDEWWRIVDLEYGSKNNDWDIVDWTHEREWRVPGDMEFEYSEEGVSVIVDNPNSYEYFLKNCPGEILQSIWSITTLSTILM